MHRIDSVGSPKISPRLGTSNRQGAHKETKTGDKKYKRENQDSIRNIDTNRDMHPKTTIEKRKLYIFAYHETLNLKK